MPYKEEFQLRVEFSLDLIGAGKLSHFSMLKISHVFQTIVAICSMLTREA